MPYGFVRSTDTWGVNSLPWQNVRDAGLDGLLFDANDPHLEQALVNARSQHLKAGIWLPAGGEGDPRAYADRLVKLAEKYGPDILVPNIEFTGKGYKGSPGWQFNDDVTNALQGRLGKTPLAVAVLPRQDDFNYGAWTRLGAQIWAEAFGANPGPDNIDPAYVRSTLLANGVPADLAYSLLAPGQPGTAPTSGVFTIDDLNGDQWSALRAAVTAAGSLPLARTSPARSGSSSPGSSGGSSLEDMRRLVLARRGG